ncbi:hypothetical protein CDD82_1081 [Ophiocordyceps australis]|uniref:Uncharacterized protein n=1 Tax=Ophiocordyceps australis TaxID=1399860 RepID=A0A2C5ZQQ6_9HYPO|nr:hypothetical protein CDD82_1081 [Ophiocordyceps australis]
MDEQAPAASTLPPANRYGKQATLPASTLPRTSLSNSEPSLRFPTPLGNRHLFQWISASDPDLMRLTTTVENSGLDGSAYGLIISPSGEIHDGDFSESGTSLDTQPSDDVHSLADCHSLPDAGCVSDAEWTSSEAEMPLHITSIEQHESIQAHDGTLRVQPQPLLLGATHGNFDSENHELYGFYSSDSDAFSNPASDIIKASAISTINGERLEPESPVLQVPGISHNGKQGPSRYAHINSILATAVAFMPHALRCLFFIVLIGSMCHSAQLYILRGSVEGWFHRSAPPPPIKMTMMPPSRPMQPGSMKIVPLNEKSPIAWLSSIREPVISFTPRSQTDILIRVSNDIKKHWLAKNCLTVGALRQDSLVKTSISPVNDGLLLKFPSSEANGILQLSFTTSCRPKLHRVMSVYFSPSVAEEVYYETTRYLAQKVPAFVSTTMAEAKQHFQGVRQALGAASKMLGHSVVDVSGNLANRMDDIMADVYRSIKVKGDAMKRIRSATEEIAVAFANISSLRTRQQLIRIRELRSKVQLYLHLGLLDAQVSAKSWWLKAMLRREERIEYTRKAKEYLARQRSAAQEAKQTRRSRLRMGKSRGNGE